MKAFLPSGPAPRTITAGLARGLRRQIDVATQTRLYLGVYDLELDNYLRRMLRPGMTAFDVGAQYGYDSLPSHAARLAMARHSNATTSV